MLNQIIYNKHFICIFHIVTMKLNILVVGRKREKNMRKNMYIYVQKLTEYKLFVYDCRCSIRFTDK